MFVNIISCRVIIKIRDSHCNICSEKERESHFPTYEIRRSVPRLSSFFEPALIL